MVTMEVTRADHQEIRGVVLTTAQVAAHREEQVGTPPAAPVVARPVIKVVVIPMGQPEVRPATGAKVPLVTAAADLRRESAGDKIIEHPPLN